MTCSLLLIKILLQRKRNALLVVFPLLSKAASRRLPRMVTATHASLVLDDVRSSQFDDLAPATCYMLQAHVAPRPCKLIRIHNNSNGDPVCLAQVQAWDSDGTNRASARNGGVAWQTSTAHGGSARRAIDDNTSGLWCHKSVTHTALSPQEYWQVVLNPPSFIYSVDVFNRTDCCSHRLAGANLQIIDTDDELFYQKTLNGDDMQRVIIPSEGG